METSITFQTNKINISNIGQFNATSGFEKSCISFIEEWLFGKETFLQHTSGSTGAPKIIEINRAQMIASAMMTINALALKPKENCLLCLSPDYIAGKMMIVRALINKMNIIAIEPTSNPLIDLTCDIHFAAFTPMQMQTILSAQTSAQNIRRLDKVILGGGYVDTSLQKKLSEVKCDCYNTYGMTETVSHIALKKLNGSDQSDYFTILDEIEVDQDARDCLTIKGAVTNFQTITTNDRVRLVNDRQFEWLGRADNVINSGGIKIQSEKIELAVGAVFNDLSITNRYFVAGLPDEKLGEKLVLIIEGNLQSARENEILRALKDQVGKYELPKSIVKTAKFAETSTGKIQRRATLNALI